MQSVTLYYPGTSFFHLCDCRVKLLLMLIFTVIAFLFYNPIVPAALFIAALLMNLSAIGTRTFKNFLFKMILVMMAFLLVLHGFANPNGSVPAQFWGHQLRIPFFGCYTVDGFYLGLVFWLRLSSIVLIAMLFVTTTSSAEIMRGLQKLGVPFRFCFMLTMSLQLIPITAREAGIIGPPSGPEACRRRTSSTSSRAWCPCSCPWWSAPCPAWRPCPWRWRAGLSATPSIPPR